MMDLFKEILKPAPASL